MSQTRSHQHKRAFLFFFVASFLFSACSGLLQNANWPGVTADDNLVYVAYGPSVRAFDIEAREELWTYPAEPQGQRSFYAAPSVLDDRIVIGDYGTPGSFFSPGVSVSVVALREDPGSDPDELWTAADVASDRIVAAPLQVGDTVYLGTADNLVLALDATTGTELWRFEEAKHSIWAQPAYADGTLYVVSLDKSLYALDAESGSLKWELAFAGSLLNKPVIRGDMLYAGSFDSKLHAVDLATGTEAWSAEGEGWVWAGPAVDNGNVFYADLNGNVYGVSAATGEPQWSVENTEIGLVQATPLVVGDLVIFAGGDPEGEEVRRGSLTAYDTATGEEAWQTPTDYPVFTDPILVGDKLVVTMVSENGQLYLYLFDPMTGDSDGAPIEPAGQEAS